MNPPSTRRRFLRQAVASMSLMPLSRRAFSVPSLPPPQKSNFLLLMADDYMFDRIHALGCEEIQTPNLDRLVRRATCFTNCYNQGGWSGAVCVASRTMLFTGRFLWKAREMEHSLKETCEAEGLWPQQLGRAGYHTCFSGKWHINCDPGAVFQRVLNVRPGMPPDIPAQYNRPRTGQDDTFNPSDPSLGGYFSGGRHWSETTADDGIAFLREASKREEPFFIHLSFNAPHDPRQAPAAYLRLYDPERLSLPETFQPEYPGGAAIGCGPGLRDERLAPFPRTPEAVRAHRREYYALISHLDAQIGRVLDALELAGLTDSTYILFTSDNGLALGAHGLMGKQNMYDHSMKVPLVIAGPGIPSGQRRNGLTYMQDIAPTLLDLAGISPAKPMDYQSLSPLLYGSRDSVYTSVYGAYMDLQRMVRTGDYKLIYYPALERLLLFNLETDPQEQNDLINSQEEGPVINRLKATMRSMQQQLEDPLILPS